MGGRLFDLGETFLSNAGSDDETAWLSGLLSRPRQGLTIEIAWLAFGHHGFADCLGFAGILATRVPLDFFLGIVQVLCCACSYSLIQAVHDLASSKNLSFEYH